MDAQHQDHGRRLWAVIGNLVARTNLHRKNLRPARRKRSSAGCPAKNMTAKKFHSFVTRQPGLGPPQSSQAASSSQAGADASGAGIRSRDLDRDLYGEMVRCGSDPRALQRNGLARLVHDRDAHEVLIPDHAARRIEVDPTRAGNIDLDPGMSVAPGDTSTCCVGTGSVTSDLRGGFPGPGPETASGCRPS